MIQPRIDNPKPRKSSPGRVDGQMAETSKTPEYGKLGGYGVERRRKDDEGAAVQDRDKWPWFDHIMRMNERYGEQGGNQFAAGITYFSVLSIFPLTMLVLATVAIVLANN